MIQMFSDLYHEIIRRRTSVFEVGGEYVSTYTSERSSSSPRITKESDHTNSSDISGRAVSSLDSPVTPSVNRGRQRHIPYSYGNPVFNLGANIIIRGIEATGYEPEWKKEEEALY
jgi:hypothetical protein